MAPSSRYICSVQNYYQWILSIIMIKAVNKIDMTRFFIILHQTINHIFFVTIYVINLPSFHPFFVLKLEVRALSQNVCNGICGLVALKIFSGEVPQVPYDFRAFSARSRTNYFKVATPLVTAIVEDFVYC